MQLVRAGYHNQETGSVIVAIRGKGKKNPGTSVEPERLPVEAGATGIEDEDPSSGEDSSPNDDSSAEERITQPFDPTKIRVESKPMTIDLLLTRIGQGELDLAPGFQRKGGLWKNAAQSRLIESILIRIPLPAFYMDATDDNKWLVVDGLQRLTSLKRFVLENDLRLEGLEFLSGLEGKRFKDLPRNFQRRIHETQITAYLIEKGTPQEVKFNIFKRINTSGLPLSAQEIRHALNQGEAPRFLATLAKRNEFLAATDHGIRDERMADQEFVLRFLAFSRTPYHEYRSKDFDGFLNNEMTALNLDTPQVRLRLETQFIRAMVAAQTIFGRDAFRKRYNTHHARYPLNKALFEAWSTNLSQLTEIELSTLEERKGQVKEAFMALMRTNEFDSSVSQGTGDPKKVRFRFGRIEDLLQGALS
jgi:hypothetical protein